MKSKKIVSLLLTGAMTAALLAAPAQAAPPAVRFGSYKGNTLTAGEISGLMIYPNTAEDIDLFRSPDGLPTTGTSNFPGRAGPLASALNGSRLGCASGPGSDDGRQGVPA